VIAGLRPETIQIPHDGSRCSLGNVHEFYRPYKLSPQFSVIAHIFYSMDFFFACCLLMFIDIPVAVIRSVLQLASEKGRSLQFFPQPDFVQESSGPLF
jgi:hypothetical protein